MGSAKEGGLFVSLRVRWQSFVFGEASTCRNKCLRWCKQSYAHGDNPLLMLPWLLLAVKQMFFRACLGVSLSPDVCVAGD